MIINHLSELPILFFTCIPFSIIIHFRLLFYLIPSLNQCILKVVQLEENGRYKIKEGHYG